MMIPKNKIKSFDIRKIARLSFGRVLSIVTLFCCLNLASGFSATTNTNAWIIHAVGQNRGFGPYCLGMSVAEFEKNFGTADKINRSENVSSHIYGLTYYAYGLKVVVGSNDSKDDDRITQFNFYFKPLDCRSVGGGVFSSYPGHTEEGFDSNSTKQDLEKAYGRDYKQLNGVDEIMCVWKTKGISASFGLGGKLESLRLHKILMNIAEN